MKEVLSTHQPQAPGCGTACVEREGGTNYRDERADRSGAEGFRSRRVRSRAAEGSWGGHITVGDQAELRL